MTWDRNNKVSVINVPSVKLLDISGQGLTSTLVGSDQALDVNVVAGGGGGGGVQYTEGDVDASITGTAMMWEDAGDTLRSVSSAKPLPVTATVTGTTAVSAASLPLPTGAATEAKQDVQETTLDAMETLLTTIEGNQLADGHSVVTGGLTDTELRATPVPVSGTVTSTGAGLIDATNSTSTPLGGGASYTGTSIDVTEYSGAMVQILADEDSATDGFALQTSVDGTNWDHGHTYSYTGAGGARHYTFQLPGNYARVVYTNGATPQTVFRLQTKFLKSSGLSHDHPINAPLDDDHPAAVSRSIQTGKDPAGNYSNSGVPGLAFSTTALLGNGATYDSGVLDLRAYTQVQTQVLSDVDGTWIADFCSDSAGTDILRTLTVPHTASANMLTFAAPAFSNYVRYRFTADQAGQTDFYFDTKFLTGALAPQILNAEAFISPLMTAQLNRSVSVGLDAQGNYTNEKLGGTAFMTTTPLAGAATYSSGVLDLQGFSQVQTHVLADEDGTINIYWYSDSAGTDQVRLLTIPYTASDGFQTFAAPAFTPYVKYEFTNDGSLQTDFFFDTKFLTKAISAQILTPSGSISDLMTAALTRSVLVGKSSAGGGSYVNVKVNPSGTLETNANQGGTWDINDISGTISLPTGAATEATLSSIEKRTIKSVSGSANTSGEQTIVAAAGASTKIKVLSYKLTTKSSTEVLATWLDGTGGTELYRTRAVSPNADISFGETNNGPLPAGLFTTSDNTALILNLSGAIAVDYSISYITEA